MKKNLSVRGLLAGMMAENTILLYENAWRKYQAFAGCNEIEAATLIEWRQFLVASGEYSASSINNYIKGIKAIAKQLYATKQLSKEHYYDIRDVEYLPGNALTNRRRPNNKIHIEPEQMRELCTAQADDPVELRDRAFMLTLATTGCRISEALDIKVTDIRRTQGGCVVNHILGKWQQEARTAPLSTEAHDAICRWLEMRPIHSEYVFTATTLNLHDGSTIFLPEPVKRQAMLSRIKKYGEKAGVPHIKAHDFRRFVATQVIKKAGIRTAQKVLGHANISSTAAYDTANFEPSITEELF